MPAARHHSPEIKSKVDKLLIEGVKPAIIKTRIRGIDDSFIKRRRQALRKSGKLPSSDRDEG